MLSRRVLFAVSLLLSVSADAASREVGAFGAKGDGVTLDTSAIQRTIDAVAADGGGEVVLTSGTYLSGTLYLKSHVTLRLERAACLRGSPDLRDYNAEDAYPQNWGSPKVECWRGRHLLLALEQEDVGVVGEGIVDGNGSAFFTNLVHGVGKTTWRFGAMNAKDRANAVRAGQMLVFVECRGVRVEGVRLYDAPCWNCFCHGCENVRIRDVTAIADIRHHNTDGFDIDCCRDVVVSGCEVETGDDCFTVRADVKRLKTPRVCEDVRFENCRGACSACGVRIGVGDGTIRNVAFSNLVIRTAGIGIAVQSNYSGKNRRGVDISDVRFDDFALRDTSKGLLLTYGVGTPSAALRDIRFARGTVEATHPLTIVGNGAVTPDGIVLTDVALSVKPDRSAEPRTEPVLVEKAGRVAFDRVTLDGKPVKIPGRN